MFNLEEQISNWRNELSRAGLSPDALDELESHLRDEIHVLGASIKSEPDAFRLAVERLGPSAHLKIEFRKLGARNWTPPLAWAAWMLFVISFFLPAYTDGAGWRCAGVSLSAWSWSELARANWFVINLALLTPANLLMIVSPFLLSRLSRRPRALKWLRGAHFTALALVWAFVGAWVAFSDRSDLRIGCYLWALSFLLFFLSLFKQRAPKRHYA